MIKISSNEISNDLESLSFNLDESFTPNTADNLTDDDKLFTISILYQFFGLDPNRPPTLRDNLEELLESNNFHFRLSSIDVDKTLFEQVPFIGLDSSDDSLVFCNIQGKHVNIVNLNNKLRYKILLSEAKDKLSFNIYEIYPTFPQTVSSGISLFKFFIPVIRKDVLSAFAFALLLNIVALSSPLITAQIVGNVVPSGSIAFISSAFVLCILIAFTQASLSWIQSYYLLRIRQKLSLSLQTALYERILSFPISFIDSYNVGDLTSRATSVSVVLNSLSSSTLTSIISTFSIIAFSLLMFYIDKQLAAISLILVTLSSCIQYSFLRRQLKYQRSLVEKEADSYNDILQSLGAIAQIRANSCEPYFLQRIFSKYLTISFENLRINRLSDYSSLVGNFISGFGLFIIYASILFRLFSSKTSPDFVQLTSTFIVFTSAFASFSSNFSSLIDIVNDLSGPVWIHWRRALPLLQQVPESGLDPGKSQIDLVPDYKFTNVSFSYPSSSKIIVNDASFSLKAGSFNVLFGPSGCGKSTILSLLLNFYHCNSGSIFVNNHDINDLDIKSYRSQIGAVLQQSTLPVGSIRDALTYGLPISEKEIWETLDKVNLLTEIQNLPMKLETILSEGAANISGGQRQRLCIARALLHKPKVLLEDEATSAIDTKSQQIIVENLKDMNITRVVVAHRLSAIKGCDHIVVFNRGKVEAEGTFMDCIDKSPYLASVVNPK